MASKSDYLKKYGVGGGNDPDKKRRKKRPSSNLTSKMEIKDDEDDANKYHTSKALSDGNSLWDIGIEENPVVVEITEDHHISRGAWTSVATNSSSGSMGRKSRRNDSSDEEPPRRHDSDDGDSAPPRRKRAETSGNSASGSNSGTMGRKSRRNDSSDEEPPRRHDSDDGDSSPPRRKRAETSGDSASGSNSGTMGRKSRRNDSSDEEPPRRHDSDDGDSSPPRRKRAETSGDSASGSNSGTMGRKSRRNDSSDEEPPRRHDSDDGDSAPPRRKRAETSGDSASGSNSGTMGRKSRRNDSSDEEPPRRHDSDDGDSSPPRRKRAETSGDSASGSNSGTMGRKSRRNDSSDEKRQDNRKVAAKNNDNIENIARGQRADQDRDASIKETSSSTESKEDSEKKDFLPSSTRGIVERRKKTASGHDAGLQTGAGFGRTEKEIKARRDEEMLSADPTQMGEGQDTVYRDRKGKKLDMLNEFMRQQAVREGKEFKIEKAQNEWGKGTVQKQEKEALRQELVDVASEPFARTIDNPRMEAMRKEIIRDGDPMAEYFARKKEKEDDEERARVGNTGEEAVVVAAKPRYKGPIGAPNRFHIFPGYRWDGIDRGNRYEHKILTKSNDRTALKEDEYRWSVSDM